MDAPKFHFAYVPPGTDLAQGDLLEKTPEIRTMLEGVHPHYLKDDYTHLLVLTQSCDLVRRKGKCKARYVSLAAVRPFDLVLEREIETFQDTRAKAAGVCSRRVRGQVENFVERVLNNNADEYFYLEPDSSLGLLEASCAFLRLSIAVRTAEHYEKMAKARILSLTDVFQAKLGWLLGKMYSRVGTPDWQPDHITEAEFKKKIELAVGSVVQWVDDDKFRRATKTWPEGEATQSELRAHIQGIEVPKKKDQVLQAVIDVIEARGAEDDRDRLLNALRNDPTVAALLK